MIGPLLPPERGRHARPAGDNRRYLNGMLHVLRVGCPWREPKASAATCMSAMGNGSPSTSGSGAATIKASLSTSS
uniref:transposase n=1 Tax=Novosphingobium sp. MBES04 TaxID=1206458 RepID=UPI001F5A7EAF|nr:transposase [Novosphingobium sp. MBES04]